MTALRWPKTLLLILRKADDVIFLLFFLHMSIYCIWRTCHFFLVPQLISVWTRCMLAVTDRCSSWSPKTEVGCPNVWRYFATAGQCWPGYLFARLNWGFDLICRIPRGILPCSGISRTWNCYWEGACAQTFEICGNVEWCLKADGGSPTTLFLSQAEQNYLHRRALCQPVTIAYCHYYCFFFFFKSLHALFAAIFCSSLSLSSFWTAHHLRFASMALLLFSGLQPSSVCLRTKSWQYRDSWRDCCWRWRGGCPSRGPRSPWLKR